MSIETKPPQEVTGFDERVTAYLAETENQPLPVSCADAQGRILPLSPEEEKADRERFAKIMEELRAVPDDDPPDTLERMMRGVDENRPPGQKLFEGMY
jgi:threonyl-tRNA synthetase